MDKIIDLSYHNTVTSWKSVKKSGITGVILRAGYGKGNVDQKFKSYIKGALSAGLKVGVYWFSYAYGVDMARKEAEFCYSLIKDYNVTLPVFFDWEYDSMNYAKKNDIIPSRQLIMKMTKAFMEYMEAKGYKTGYYTNQDYINQGLYMDSDYDEKHLKWYARYTSKQQTGCDLWQYAEDGCVAGITGKQVDMNYVIRERRFYGMYTGDLDIRLPEKGWYTLGDGQIKNKKLNNDIKKIQKFLNWYLGCSLKITGNYGPLTMAQVGIFQKRCGLPVNKKWGKLCAKKSEEVTR